MPTRRSTLTALALTVTLALAAPCVAQTENSTAPEGDAPPNQQTLTNPNANKPVSDAEIAECMKTWDPQTGMSKAEYERSCKSTLKYYPVKP